MSGITKFKHHVREYNDFYLLQLSYFSIVIIYWHCQKQCENL